MGKSASYRRASSSKGQDRVWREHGHRYRPLRARGACPTRGLRASESTRLSSFDSRSGSPFRFGNTRSSAAVRLRRSTYSRRSAGRNRTYLPTCTTGNASGAPRRLAQVVRPPRSRVRARGQGTCCPSALRGCQRGALGTRRARAAHPEHAQRRGPGRVGVAERR